MFFLLSLSFWAERPATNGFLHDSENLSSIKDEQERIFFDGWPDQRNEKRERPGTKKEAVPLNAHLGER